jgi:3-dehydroquinate synthase
MERIVVNGVSEVLVGDDLLARDRVLPERRGRSQIAVLAQPTVAGLAERVAARCEEAGVPTRVRVHPDGEAGKSLDTAAATYAWLNRCGLHRDDTIVAVGGGALTDAVGFIAATYLRGLETVYVPTTLLGAVDAAIGGKTALNLGGKNLVGVFRHPARVLIDTAVLAALPEALWREGAAEAVKAGLIGDPGLVQLFEEHGRATPMGEMVARAVAVKAEIVEEDFAETGRRAVLNYGHTIGHAIEYVAGISHGEAVAIGMIAAGAASVAVTGFDGADRQRRLLDGLGLPVEAPDIDGREVRRILALDKKRDASGVRMVLLRDVGDPIVRGVSPATVEEALQVVGIE